MADSVTPASKPESREPGAALILERLEAYKQQNPNVQAYYLTSEEEARDLLIAMVGTFELILKDPKFDNEASRAEIGKYQRQYHDAIQSGECLVFFRELADHEQLSLYGMQLKVSPMLQT